MKALKGFNTVAAVVVAFLMAGIMLVSGYVLWSNTRVYRAAGDVYSSLLDLKPDGSEPGKDSRTAFEALRAVNPDILAWLTVDNTGIDYPVVQAADNVYYMSRDVYGEFSLAGSIFLDYRNSSDFSDPHLIIYGHHVERGLMFGDLDKYRDPDFFADNKSASIITDQGQYDYTIIATADDLDSETRLFDPSHWNGDFEGFCTFLEENAILLRSETLEELRAYPQSSQIAVLVTCTSGQTGSRFVVILYRHIEPDNPPEPTETPSEEPAETPTETPTETPAETPTETGEPTETPEPTDDHPDTPVTYDSDFRWVFATIILCSMIIIAVTVLTRKKE